MNKKRFFGALSILFFLSILFNEQGSNSWKTFFGLGLISGIIWFFKK